MNDYLRIAAAIEFIRDNYLSQPPLEVVAAHIHMSPFHFQRVFKEWAGVSPKKFLQYTSLQHAKSLLQNRFSITDAALETGLSGSSRLHDLFIAIEGMTPGEFKNGGEQLSIRYSIIDSPFGALLVASTIKGICNLFFIDEENAATRELQLNWPNAAIMKGTDEHQQHVVKFFSEDWNDLSKIKLHLKGTSFQLKVWKALLTIPAGSVSGYNEIATMIDHPSASRAVGSAIGANPIAFLIPCHRVIRSSGLLGDYHWGTTRKAVIIGWESSKVYGEESLV